MAISLRYKSFCMGIVLTSITWIVSLYLYINLSSNVFHVENKLYNNVTGDIQKHKFHGTHEYPSNVVEKMSAKQLKKITYKQMLKKTAMNEVENQLNALPDENRRPVKQNAKMAEVKFEMIGASTMINSGLEYDLGMVKSESDKKERDGGYKKFAFNVLVSNRLSLRRDLPDVRHPLCITKTYQTELPKASIVVCLYNEALTTLLRTIYSVLDRTPDYLLHEIVLIDDYSDSEILATDILSSLKNETKSKKVKLFRTDKREGLIRARMFGARKATGDVLTFLDSHCEVNTGWLEPLLNEIALNKKTVVCPIIDIINSDTFVYSASPLVRGGFNWGLHFKWDSLPAETFATKEDYVKPIISPTMAGGLFAIDRHYFAELGEYDAGMDVWGGENLEISFRIWMCGGSLKIIPCSRVGHVFRKRRPYNSPDGEDTMLRNSLRVAQVWMDDYKNYFLQTRYDAKRLDYGNITERVELRKRLNCKSFDWYLKNIYPELKLPLSKEEQQILKEKALANSGKMMYRKKKTHKPIGEYQFRLSGTDWCLQSEDDVTSKGSLLILRDCRKVNSQAWFETTIHEFVLAEMLCLDATEEFPRLAKCHEMGGPQEWKYTSKVGGALYNLAAGLCIGVKNPKLGEIAVMEMCKRSSPTQWDLVDWNENVNDGNDIHHDIDHL
ncbi:hypothetical protein CHUAL_002111 [Chamberlinius hualienensis]